MAMNEQVGSDPYLSDYETGFDDLLGSDLSVAGEECIEPVLPQQPTARLHSKYGGQRPPSSTNTDVGRAARRGSQPAPKARSRYATEGVLHLPLPQYFTLQPKSGRRAAKPAAPTNASSPIVTPTPKAKSRNRIPGSIRGWGIPQYSPQDRSEFCWEFRNDPDRLRSRITSAIMAHPGYTTYQMNRFLYNEFGARVAELNSLFGCRGIGQLIDHIFTDDQNSRDLREIISSFDDRMERYYRQQRDHN